MTWTLKTPFHWLEKETGEMLHFSGENIEAFGAWVKKQGDDILQHLEAQDFIASHTSEDLPVKPAKKGA